MKEITCDMIRDLIPLYAEGLCSDDSRRAVEAHIAGCAGCHKLCEEPPEDAALPVTVPEEGAAMRRVSRKMKHGRIKIVLLSIAALGLAALFGVLSVGQIAKRPGIPSFETMWQSMDVRPLVRMLTGGNYAGFVEHAGAGVRHTAAIGSYMQIEQEQDAAILQNVYGSAFGDTDVKRIRIRSAYSESVKEAGRPVVSYAEIFYEDGRELHLELSRDDDGLYRCEMTGGADLSEEDRELERVLDFIADHELRSGWVMQTVMVSEIPFTDSEKDAGRLDRRCRMITEPRFAPDCAEHIAEQLKAFYRKGYTVQACDLSEVLYDKGAHSLYYRLYVTASDGQGTAQLCAWMPFTYEGLHPQTAAAVYLDGCGTALADDLMGLFGQN